MLRRFEEKISGHTIVYEYRPTREPDKRWSVEIFCQVMGYFLTYAPDLGAAKNVARKTLEDWGRADF